MPIVATVGFDLLDMAVLRLIVALSQHHALVGQEHGRTIPLADIFLLTNTIEQTRSPPTTPIWRLMRNIQNSHHARFSAVPSQ
jgi:hypothetical protein